MNPVETGDVLGRGQTDGSVRPARAGDAEAVGAVQARAWRAAYRQVLPPAVLDELTGPALAGPWHAAITAPPSGRHSVLVACAGTAVVGFAALAPATDPDLTPPTVAEVNVAEVNVAELTALEVDPAHTRAGHGSRLLSAAVDTLRRNGFTEVVTWVPADDAPRQAFLVSAGMVLDGARRHYAEGLVQVRLGAALA